MIKNTFHPFDTGVFTCVAANAGGMDNKTVYLDIHGKSLNLFEYSQTKLNYKLQNI